MKITIKRFDGELNYEQSYEFEPENYHNRLLDALTFIKTKKDATLTFRSGCKSGVCGSCAVLVNGVERLACKCKINDNDIIEPLKNGKIIRDLINNIEYCGSKIKSFEPSIQNHTNQTITKNDEKRIDKQSECILCQSCYSSCPVLEIKPDFLGPFVLTRVFKYTEDKKETNIKSKLDFIQSNGVWDCTLCGACTIVCPQGIDPKNDILMLRNISVMNGHNDPNMGSFSGFSMDFGFNPNGF